MKVNGITLTFDIIHKNILFLTHSEPTKNKLETLKIHWLSPQMSYHNIDNNPLPVL